MGSNYVKGGVWVEGNNLENLIARIGLVQKRLEDPGIVLQRVALLFSEMERQVFAGQGMAEEFGYNEPWEPLSDATLQRRSYYGSVSDQTLIAYGFLRAASINPKETSIDGFSKELTIKINPESAGAPATYARGNYGVYHETGTEHMPQRAFAYITPEFKVFALNIARNYFLEPMGKKPMYVPAYGEEKAPTPSALKGSAREQGITGRRAPLPRQSMSREYASWKTRNYMGLNVDHSSALSKSLQNEYQNVSRVQAQLDRLSPRAAFGKTGEGIISRAGFASRSAYINASKSVARFHISRWSGGSR